MKFIVSNIETVLDLSNILGEIILVIVILYHSKKIFITTVLQLF